MALNNPPHKSLQTHTDPTRSPEDSEPESGNEEEEEEERELEELELEVKQMANKILEYRATLPDQLMTTCTSLLLAHRPVLPDLSSGSDPGTSRDSNPGEQATTSSREPFPTEEDPKTVEKVRLLKDKMSNNISAMPIVLKRMKECMSKIEKLDSYNGTIHPAFKMKKTS
ncbi:hypothetical protein Tsubulata_023209 [Turnera subulata]|uniref:Uncharacterized protein n=1 Tax=Turnera subulata TaxID=218843 RepID=A0A9Q0F4Z7_9ROSI|nr:hypothetical protein Tsubulata_023209 [Turnera subulata]